MVYLMEDLNVSANIKVGVLDKNYKYFLNRSTILFGASGSGKSTILLEILYLLKDHVPNIMVFSPTSDVNDAFSVVPPCLVFSEINLNKLHDLYKRQQGAAKVYKKVNDKLSLEKIFKKVADERSLATVLKIKKVASAYKEKKKNDINSSDREKRESIKKAISETNDLLIKIYKKIIRENKEMLNLSNNITEDEKLIVKFLDFNPNCVVVFDDCGAQLKKFQKDEVVKQILYQGRHSFINIILTLQDDAGLDSGIKKNAFVNIFTSDQCAYGYFNRSSNSFSKKDKDAASKIISYIFPHANSRKVDDYKRLVYLRGDVSPFRYTVADEYDFKFGSPSLWELSAKLNRKKSKTNFMDDPLISEFITR